MVESVNNLQVDLRYLETFITHDPNTENRLYFIPGYQRGYTWELDDYGWIHRLLEDVAGRLTEITTDSSIDLKETFLGSIILARVPAQEVNSKNFVGDPPEIYHIVDGQQRLTTMILVLAALDYEIHRLNQRRFTKCNNYNSLNQE